MRITQKMMIDAARFYLLRQNEKLFDAQSTVASGKRITRPSDDPIGMGKILDYRTSLTATDQYIDNIKMGSTWINLGDQALDKITDFLGTARSFARDSGVDPVSRSIAAEEIKNVRNQIVQLANTRLDNRYIFGGHQTDVPPISNEGEIFMRRGEPRILSFDLAAPAAAIGIQITDAAGAVVRNIAAAGGPGMVSVAWDGLDGGGFPVPDGDYRFTVFADDGLGNPVETTLYPTYNGDDGEIVAIAAKGQTIRINSSGDDLFSTTDDVVDVLKSLKDLETELEKPLADFDPDVVSERVKDIDAALDRIKEIRARSAIWLFRLDATQKFHEEFKPKIEQLLADEEDADLNQAIVDLRAQETAYQAALELTSRIFEPTLLNFLR